MAARILYISTSIENADEIDVKNIQPHGVRALLFPESPWAFKSCRSVLTPVSGRRRPLPSPDTTSGEENSSDDEVKKGCEEAELTQHCSPGTSHLPVSRPVILLIQSTEVYRFTLGSSPKNDIVLESKGGYVNLLHCCIYPHPDSDAVVLYNFSSSTFSIHPLSPGDKIRVVPSNSVHIPYGTWRLTLGEGLCFQIRIFPRPSPEEQGCTTSLLSSCKTPLRRPGGLRHGKDSTKKKVDVDEEKMHNSIPMSHTIQGSVGTILDQPDSTTAEEGKPASRNLVLARKTEVSPSILVTTGNTQVFRVTRPNGSVFAAKVCRDREIKGAADTWNREAKTLQKLRNPHIVELYGFDARTLTLRLQYIPGLSLHQSINDAKYCTITDSESFSIWSNISNAISYLHGEGILHNDIKPGNIIFNPESGAAVLCDFGLAASPAEPVIGGTPHYLAPEFLIGWNMRSFSSDMWAFGVTMLFVTRRIPRPQRAWCIAQITEESEAKQKFKAWLESLQRVIEKLPERFGLINEMLKFGRSDRIEAKELAKQLEISSWARSSRQKRQSLATS